MKKLKLLLVSILSVTLVACSSGEDINSVKNGDSMPITEVIDREGNTITKPESKEKIVSLAPSITETLVNLGLQDNIIAVDPYSLEVDGISKELPTFDIMAPNIESIVSLQPDIVFATGMSNANGTSPFDALLEFGTFITVIPTPTTLQGLTEDIYFIGEVTETTGEAVQIVNSFMGELEEVQEAVEDYIDTNGDKGYSVYFETSPAPYMYTFGANVFLNEYLELLQVENIFGDLDNWLSISEEQVIEKNPDIIFTNATYEENPDINIKNRDGWEVISAVKGDRVYVIDANESARPNEFSIEALKDMANYIYDDILK